MSESASEPAYDGKIYQKYSKKTFQNKEKNKVAFCQDRDLPYQKKIPLIAITCPLTDKNGAELLEAVMEGLMEIPVEVVLMAVGSPRHQEFFSKLAEANPRKVLIVESGDELRHRLYAAADLLLVAGESEECLKEAKNAMAYGVIPVMGPQNFATDYDPVQEKGNAFIYTQKSPWSVFGACIRALENYRFPYDWKNIALEAMESMGA